MDILKSADRMFRFLCGLSVRDQPVSVQREYLDVVREMKGALRPTSETISPSLIVENPARSPLIKDLLKDAKALITKVSDYKKSDNADPFIAKDELVHTFDCGRMIRRTYSEKDGGRISILCTPLHLMHVVDIDFKLGNFNYKGIRNGSYGKCDGYMLTSNGVHIYQPWYDSGWDNHQDPLYKQLSGEQGYWGERLFNSDGSQRTPVVNGGNIAESCKNVKMTDHALKFLQAQVMEAVAGRHKVEKRPIFLPAIYPPPPPPIPTHVG